MKIKLKTTRKVLFEKYNIIHELEHILLSNINGCRIKKGNAEFSSSIFLCKKDKILFEIDKSTINDSNKLWIRDELWFKCRAKNNLSFDGFFEIIITIIQKIPDKRFSNIKSILYTSFNGVFRHHLSDIE